MIIRQALVTDAAAIAALVNRAYRPAAGDGGWTHERGLVAGARVRPEQIVAALGHSRFFVSADAGTGQLQASVQVAVQENKASIGMLAVHPNAQKQGLGQALLAHAEQHARQVGAVLAVLTVVAGRDELVAFYCRKGYHLTRERRPFPVDADVGQPLVEALSLVVLTKTL